MLYFYQKEESEERAYEKAAGKKAKKQIRQKRTVIVDCGTGTSLFNYK